MHIDIAPTILEICGVTKPADVKLDGRSIWPLLTRQQTNWPDRTLFSQSHRGDEPVLYHNFAARNQKWKLVSATGFALESLPASGPKFELFDMERDPYEQHDISAQNPDIIALARSRFPRRSSPKPRSIPSRRKNFPPARKVSKPGSKPVESESASASSSWLSSDGHRQLS